MSELIPVQTPGGYAPGVALGLDDGTGHFVVVSDATPLPVAPAPPTVPDPLEGLAFADVLVGPFEPTALAPVYCTLEGDWQGSVQLKRSVDGGATLSPLTLAGSPWAHFTGNINEPLWQESQAGATLWLDCRISSGSLSYRLSQ